MEVAYRLTSLGISHAVVYTVEVDCSIGGQQGPIHHIYKCDRRWYPHQPIITISDNYSKHRLVRQTYRQTDMPEAKSQGILSSVILYLSGIATDKTRISETVTLSIAENGHPLIFDFHASFEDDIWEDSYECQCMIFSLLRVISKLSYDAWIGSDNRHHVAFIIRRRYSEYYIK